MISSLLSTFLFGSLFIAFQNLLQIIILFVSKMKCSLSPGYLIIKNNRLMSYIKGVYGRIVMKANTIFNTHMLYQHYFFMYTEREFPKISALNLLFLFIFLSRWINSKKLELVHLHKNMKSTLTSSINVTLKVTRVFCIINSSVIDWEKGFKLSKSLTLKLCIEQNILLLLFLSKIYVIFYCKVLKVFSFKLFPSF